MNELGRFQYPINLIQLVAALGPQIYCFRISSSSYVYSHNYITARNLNGVKVKPVMWRKRSQSPNQEELREVIYNSPWREITPIISTITASKFLFVIIFFFFHNLKLSDECRHSVDSCTMWDIHKKKRNNCGLLILKRSIEERSQRTGTYSTCTQAQMC